MRKRTVAAGTVSRVSDHLRRRGFYADDATGQPSVPPGIETDRAAYRATAGWEGDSRPADPDAPRYSDAELMGIDTSIIPTRH
jgi:hypothetical protein